MKRNSLFLLLIMTAIPAYGQDIEMQILLPSFANMPRTLGEWEADPSVVQIIMTNLSSNDLENLRFSFNVRGATRGAIVLSDDRHPAQPRFSLAPNEVRTFLWDEVINTDAIDYNEDLEEEIIRDGIPEDNYQICASVLDQFEMRISIGSVTCSPFRVMEPDPPTLIFPVASQGIDATTLRFQWTPVPEPTVEYRLMIKPRFAGQSETDAMLANPDIFDEVVNMPFYQYLPSDAPLDLYPEAVGFVWQVQSLFNGEPYGRNEGLSRVETFRELGEGEVAGSGEVPDGPPLVDVPACGVDAVALVAPVNQQPIALQGDDFRGRRVNVGYFVMEILEASGAGGFLSGTGRIEAPFLEKTIDVRFEGIKVNTDLEVFEGTVEATQREAARLTIDWLNSDAVLSNLAFAPDGAKVDAELLYNLPSFNQELGLAARDLRITPNGVRSGSARLGLSSDLVVPFGEAALRYKGSQSAETGTYVQWGCAGFERALITIEQEFPRSWLIPVSEQGDVLPGQAVIRFQAEIDAQQPSVLPTGTLERAMLAAAPGFILERSQVTLDLSTQRNPGGLEFPDRYEGITGDLWMGVFIDQFLLTMPESFKSFGRTDPVQIGGENILIDRSGMSAAALVRNILTLQTGNLGGWGFSIDQFTLNLVSNSLISGQLDGEVLVPIGSTPMAYTATISVPEEWESENHEQADNQRTNNRNQGAAAATQNLAAAALALANEEEEDHSNGLIYNFQIRPASDIQASLFGTARMELFSTSKIEVTIQKVNGQTQFKPRAELNGRLSITQDVSLAGMRFQGFTFTTESPYINKGVWSFASPQHALGGGNPDDEPMVLEGGQPTARRVEGGTVSGIPITINNIEVLGRMESGVIKAGIQFDVGVNLPGAKAFFSANTTIGIWGRLDRPANAPMRPAFDRVDISRICASGGLAGVLEINPGSCLQFYKNDPTYGDGIAGSISADILKTLNLTTAARFGKVRGMDYWYVDGAATLRTGIAFPVVSVIGFYGFQGGVYYHMTKRVSGGNTTYVPDSNILLGLKAGIILGTYPQPATLNGDVNMEAAFTTRGGLQYISIFGNGYMMSPIINRPNPVPVKATMDITYNFPRNVLDGNFRLDINAAGIIRGGGQAQIHVSSAKFFMRVGVGGSPTQPIITDASKFYVSLGGVLTARAYMATGTNGTLPPFPAVPRGAPAQPAYVRSMLTNQAGGGGVIFGASLSLNFNVDGGFVGADVNGAAGFDVALVDKGNRTCNGRRVGIEGWYANGQIYAYVRANGWIGMSESVTEWINDGIEWIEDVGCEIASWFGACDKVARQRQRRVTYVRPVRYSIMSAYAGATFSAGLPNPTWYAGTLQLKYTALGAFKGSTSVDFSEGVDENSQCRL